MQFFFFFLSDRIDVKILVRTIILILILSISVRALLLAHEAHIKISRSCPTQLIHIIVILPLRLTFMYHGRDIRAVAEAIVGEHGHDDGSMSKAGAAGASSLHTAAACS